MATATKVLGKLHSHDDIVDRTGIAETASFLVVGGYVSCAFIHEQFEKWADPRCLYYCP